MATEEEISPLLAQESDPPGLEMRRLRKESIRWVLQEGFGEGRSQWIHLGMSRLTESLGADKGTDVQTRDCARFKDSRPSM